MKKSIVDACLAQQTDKKDLSLQHTRHACVLLQVDTVLESIVMLGILCWDVRYSLTKIHILNLPVLTYNFVHRLSLHVQDTGVRGHQGM